MPLNKQSGNMYPWVTHTLTILNGACPHECRYCYVNDLKRYPVLAEKYSGPPRLVESDFELNLGSGNTIFVCSTHDLFADAIPDEFIGAVLGLLFDFPDNTYLLQTKNPARFSDWSFPPNTVLGTTVESDIDYNISRAPSPMSRLAAMKRIGLDRPSIPLMLSIEPIMDFTPTILIPRIKEIMPKFVSIGADSKGHNLPEPSSTEKVEYLIDELGAFTEVKLKANLARLGIDLNEFRK